LHRLRRSLRDDVDPLQRRGEIVALAPSVDLDTTRFEKLATGTLNDRRQAVEVYAGAVAWGQLAYDDVAVPLRRRLAKLWLGISSQVLVADAGLPRATIAHIATVARRDAATDPELADLCRAAERRLR
jgi:DNA-binding SARP family transcriptional activator